VDLYEKSSPIQYRSIPFSSRRKPRRVEGSDAEDCLHWRFDVDYLPGDTLCHEVKKQFQHDSSFVEAMDGIVSVFTIEEREKMCNLYNGRSNFVQKMKELQMIADGHCVFEGLGEVVEKLCGKGEVDDDDDENEEEEHLLSVVDEAHERLYKECFACGVPKSDVRSLAILDCFESNGAAKRDARSQAILKRYCYEDFMLTNYGRKIRVIG
jgi:hypothetical protein